MTAPVERQIFTIKEAAVILGRTRESVSRDLLATGRLAFVREPGGRRYVTRRAIDDYLALLEAEAGREGEPDRYLARILELEGRLEALEARLDTPEAS